MTGIRVRAKWDTEPSYGDVPTTDVSTWHIFGANTEMNVERNNDMKFLNNLGSPYFAESAPGPYTIRASVSFATNPDHIEWLEVLQGKWTTTTEAGVSTHTFTRDWDESHGNWRRNKSFTLRYSKLNKVIDSSLDDETVDIRGCVINSATLNYEQSNATLNVRLEILGRKDYPNAGPLLPYTAPSGRSAVFGSLQRWSGSAWENIALTDRADITISNNISMIKETGTRYNDDYALGVVKAEVNTRCRSKSPETYIHTLYGASTGPQDKIIPAMGDLRFYMTNGKTGTDERSVSIKLEDCYVNSVSQSFNPSQPIFDSPRITARKVTVEIVNESPQTVASPTAVAPSDESITVGQTVTFDGSGSTTDDPMGLTYTWGFVDGDLQILYGDMAEYTFNTAGSFTVYMTVKDSYGQTDTDTMTVTVSE